MIQYFYKTIKEKNLIKLQENDKPWEKRGIWVNVENPTEDELKHIVKNFPLEKSLLKDVLDPHEVPRLEFEQGIIYIITRLPIAENNDVFTVPFLIAVHNNFILTLSGKKKYFIR
ncbi:hypothetical protein HRbin34_00394 [bacterium HR34]|nr:hypothetical protein HRbin34_00394 [bacterium HR34]